MRAAFFVFAFVSIIGWSRGEAPAAGESVRLTYQSRWPHEGGAIAPNARVTWGRLPNGLRYAILPNQTPAGHLSLRLLVHAGSLHEQEDERGYAHFVEHMAFNGTRRFPAGELIKILQRSGADFGPHVNAFTTPDHTYYLLNFPESSPEKLTTGLSVLRDYCDALEFNPAEVAREKGVILSEEQTRRTPDFVLQEKIAAHEYRGTLLPERSPIGTTASINKATAEKLKKFHDTWYRPERMTLLVVGDITVDAAQAAIEREFATLAARTPPPVEPVLGRIAPREQEQVEVFKQAVSGVSFAFKSTRSEIAPPPDSIAGPEGLALHLAVEVFKKRLARLTDNAATRIFSGNYVDFRRPYNHFRTVQIFLNGSQFQWEQVLGTGEQEIRRMIEHGVLEEELQLVRTEFLTVWKQYAALSPQTSTTDLMSALHHTLSEDEIFLMPDDYLKLAEARLTLITPEHCQRAFARAWGSINHHVLLTTYGDKPAKADVVAALAASRATPVEPPAPNRKIEFVYQDFGTPGAVAFKQHVKDLDLWLVQFANGVRLNLKRSTTQPGLAIFSLRFGPGAIEEPADKPGLRLWLPGLLYGGLGLHSADDVGKLLEQRGLNRLHLQCGPDSSLLVGYCGRADLAFNTQLMTALLTDPAYSYSSRERMQAELNTNYDSMYGTAAIAHAAYVEPFLFNNDLRFSLPTRDTHSNYSLDDLRDWLAPHLKDGRLELAIVGDVEIDETIAQVAQTLGTLAPRKTKPQQLRHTSNRLPTAPRSFIYDFPTAERTRPATLQFYWPLRAKLDMRTRRHLELLASILNDRIRIQIREALGATYSANTQVSYTESLPALSYLWSQLDVQSAQAEKISGLVSRLAHELAQNGPTIDELERARQPLLSQARQAPRENLYWLYSVLGDAQLRPERLNQARSLSQDYASATQKDIARLAKTYLSSDNLLRFILRPQFQSPNRP